MYIDSDNSFRLSERNVQLPEKKCIKLLFMGEFILYFETVILGNLVVIIMSINSKILFFELLAMFLIDRLLKIRYKMPLI